MINIFNNRSKKELKLLKEILSEVKEIKCLLNKPEEEELKQQIMDKLNALIEDVKTTV